jgi:chromosome segregation ATPase
MSKTFTQEVVDAIAEVNELTNSLTTAEGATSRARNNETDIRNKLNSAQRQLDQLIHGLKRLAPKDSDWKRAPERHICPE